MCCVGVAVRVRNPVIAVSSTHLSLSSCLREPTAESLEKTARDVLASSLNGWLFLDWSSRRSSNSTSHSSPSFMSTSTPSSRPRQAAACNHSKSGVCSVCVHLTRSFNLPLSSSAVSSTPASANSPCLPTRITHPFSAPSTSSTSSNNTSLALSRGASLDGTVSATVSSSTPTATVVPFIGPTISRARYLPVSAITTALNAQQSSASAAVQHSSPAAPPAAAITTEPLSIDPAQLSAAMTRMAFEEKEVIPPSSTKARSLLEGRPRKDRSPSPAEEAYTSFQTLRERAHEESSRKVSSPNGSQSLLQRLFESELCDVVMTLHYLHTAKEGGVISYLGNKLFQLPHSSVDFFVPQLINLFINFDDVAQVIRPYITARCKESTHFALDCCWLMEAFGHERRLAAAAIKGSLNDAERFRMTIASDFDRPQATSFSSFSSSASVSDFARRSSVAERGEQQKEEQSQPNTKGGEAGLTAGGHVRSSSDAMLSSIQEWNPAMSSNSSSFSTTAAGTTDSGSGGLRRVESSLSTLRFLAPGGTLPHGNAFDSGCICFDGEVEEEETKECQCGTERLRAEQQFVRALTAIGERLKHARTKKEKSCRLVSELHLLNAHLPARVWIPLYAAEIGEHIVLRIPPNGGCVLNSKDKAPYCIYVEVQTCADARRARLPPRLSEAEAELHERLNSLTRGTPQNRNGCSFNRGENAPGEGGRFHGEDAPVEVAIDAAETLSQQSWCSSNEEQQRTVKPGDIRRRLRELLDKPRRQMRNLPDDPSAHAMSEPWEEKRERLRVSSPYGRLPGWQLLPVIVKTGDDLRQELLAYQLLKTLERIWSEEGVPLWLRPYKIIVLSHDSGMIEPIVDACSLHQIKRNQTHVFQEEGRTDASPSLLTHFIDSFGHIHSETFLKAQDNLVRSAAAYSLACYFLQVKDRHNGNILVDAEGHLIHIDFGFILSASPRNLGFETSPFKLTSEIVDVMGGTSSDFFSYFKILMLQGMLAARKHLDRIMNIVEIMIHGSPLACFRGGSASLKAMRSRFHLNYTEAQLQAQIDQMVEYSRDSLTTRLYDQYQYYSNGIL